MLQDVHLGATQDAFSLSQLEARLDLWASLSQRAPVLAQLSLRGVSVTLAEDAPGVWQVRGLSRAGGSETPSVSTARVLEGLRHIGYLGITDSQIRIQPLEAPEQVLNELTLGLSDEAGALRLDLQALPQAGKLLALNARLQIDPLADQGLGRFELYLKLPTMDWASWIPAHWLQKWRMPQAQFGAEVWLEGAEGHLKEAAVRFAAPHLYLGYKDQPLVALNQTEALLHVRQQAAGYQLFLEHLGLAVDQNPPISLQLNAEQQVSSQGAQPLWHLQLDALSLMPLTNLVQRLGPLSDEQAALLKDLSPRGRLTHLTLDYDPNRADAERIQFSANLEQVSFGSHQGSAAASNVTGSILGTLAQGALQFDSENFGLYLPKFFDHPWQHQRGLGQIAWRSDEHGVRISAPFLRLQGEDGIFTGDLLMQLYKDPKVESYMDLRIGLRDGDTRYIGRYLPTRSPTFSKEFGNWVTAAVRAGRIEQGYYQYQGALNDDSPPIASTKDFYFKLSALELEYQKGWPPIQNGQADIVVEDTGSRIQLTDSRLLNSQIPQLSVTIPSVPDNQPLRVLVKGRVQGQIADGLEILKAAALNANEVARSWQGDGQLQAQLDLNIPLSSRLKSQVKIDFSTQGATLVMAQLGLRLEQLSGQFCYETDKGVSASRMEAKLLGGSIKARLVEAGHSGDPFGRIEAWGQVSVERLGAWLGLEHQLPMSGTLPFELSLNLADQDSQLQINSTLQGTRIDLPEPFGKSAQGVRPINLRMMLHGRERRYWMQYANLASLSFAAPPDHLNKGRGELRLGGGAARLPTTAGLQVQGQIATLDVDEWRAWWGRSDWGSDKGKYPKGKRDKKEASFNPDWLSNVQLHIDRFQGFGLSVSDVETRLVRQAKGWQLGVESALVTGQLLYPYAPEAPLDIHLQRLQVPEEVSANARSDDGSQDPLANLDPRSIPAMDVKVDEASYGKASLGRWAVQLRPQKEGVAFTGLDVNLRGVRVNGSGTWRLGQTTYQGRLQGDDLGEVLNAWGFAPSVTSDNFRVDVEGHWPGSPAGLDIKRFSGILTPRFRHGRFVEVEPQTLRVFGLLNFNAINRRLRLDFSDLISEGLSYDEFKGQLRAVNGVYSTRDPLVLNGPSMNMEFNGLLDLPRDQIQARLLVVLPVTNNLPLAAIVVGAPAVGGALWVMDKLLGLSRHIAQLATVQYRVTGSWQSPDISFDKPFEKPRS